MARPIALTGSDQAVYDKGPGIYKGFSIRETAGAAATVRIYDNAAAASGTLLDTIELAADESRSEWYGGDSEDGLAFAAGVYVKVVTGAVEGSVRLG